MIWCLPVYLTLITCASHSHWFPFSLADIISSSEHTETIFSQDLCADCAICLGCCHPGPLILPLTIIHISANRLIWEGSFNSPPPKLKFSPPQVTCCFFLSLSISNRCQSLICLCAFCLHLLINISTLNVSSWSVWFFSESLGFKEWLVLNKSLWDE